MLLSGFCGKRDGERAERGDVALLAGSVSRAASPRFARLRLHKNRPVAFGGRPAGVVAPSIGFEPTAPCSGGKCSIP